MAGLTEPPHEPAKAFQASRKTVYVARSHDWLYGKLFEKAALPSDVELVPERGEAELIIYLEPPWLDDAAPDRLRDFTPRQLARTFVYSQDDLPIPWAPGMYASLPFTRRPGGAAFSGGFYVPHQRREAGGLAEHLESARSLTPDLLWSFAGTAQNADVRRCILTIRDARALVEDTQRFSDTVRWGWTSTHRDEAQVAFRRYATTLGRSKFVLCPRGRGPSSIRLFEALETGRCPVIVADDWWPPPFVQWDSCSIRIAERDVHKVPAILRSRESDAHELGANARAVWERLFSPEAQLSTLISGCLAISERITTRTRVAVGLGALTERSTMARVKSSRLRTGLARALI